MVSGTARPLARLDPDRNHNHRGRLRGHQGNAARDGRRVAAGPDGQIRIWLDRKFVDRLRSMRGPGESYSDVILPLANA